MAGVATSGVAAAIEMAWRSNRVVAINGWRMWRKRNKPWQPAAATYRRRLCRLCLSHQSIMALEREESDKKWRKPMTAILRYQ